MVNTGKLLGYLDLNGCCSLASTCAEPVEDIVELDAGSEVGINNGLHNLPEHLQEAYPLGVCVSLGDQDHYGTPQLPCHLHGAPNILDYAHEIHTSSRFLGVFLPLPDRPCGAT